LPRDEGQHPSDLARLWTDADQTMPRSIDVGDQKPAIEMTNGM
jgi:hypothetical protein